MAQAEQEAEGKAVPREKVRRKDLKELHMRLHCWNQLHPKTGRFRRKKYTHCVPWITLDETFIVLPEGEEERGPNHVDWIRGTYTACVPVSDGLLDQEAPASEVLIPITLSLDFSRKGDDLVRWSVDIRASQIHAPAAYPGVHSGYLKPINFGSFNSVYEVYWDKPIFSPYVGIESPRRFADKEDYEPITMKLRDWPVKEELLREAGYQERVLEGQATLYVYVIQPVLRDVARLLVFGPRYEDMKVPPLYKYPNLFESWYDSDMLKQLQCGFFQGPHFPEAALFFCRAFNPSEEVEDDKNKADSDEVLRERCDASVRIILTLFEHFNIIREPAWLKHENEDWVDDLEAEAKMVKTVADLREFELKWACVVSYACGMNLHEGPWAGKNWAMRVDGES